MGDGDDYTYSGVHENSSAGIIFIDLNTILK